MLYMYLYFLLPIITALIHIGVTKRPFPKGRSFEIWLTHIFFWMVGIAGIIAYIFNAYGFLDGWTARWFGFGQSGSYQELVGMAYLAFGVLGILCVLFRGGFWVATAIASVVFAIGHAWVFFFHGSPTRILVYALCYCLVGSGILIALLLGYCASAGENTFWDCRGTCAVKPKRKTKRK